MGVYRLSKRDCCFQHASCSLPMGSAISCLFFPVALSRPWRVHGDATSIWVGDGPLAKASLRWRILNLSPVTYGWVIGELEFYSDTGCSRQINVLEQETPPEAIASGHHEAPPVRAMDRATWTEWRAQCYLCDPREAWLGIRLSQPEVVHCVKLWQIGRRGYKTAEVALERWDDLEKTWQ